MDPYVHDGTQVDPEGETIVRRPVTERSRITGRSARMEHHDGRPSVGSMNGVDWGAVVASVLTGMAVSTLLVILGVATGLIAGNENSDAGDAKGILGALGAWFVIAMLIGSFVGSLLGGRLARWLNRGSLAYHAATSWALATLLSLLLATLVTIGFATSANSAATAAVANEANEAQTQNAAGAQGAAAAAGNEPDGAGGDAAARDAQGGTNGEAGGKSSEQAADDTGDALGGAGVALSIGMILTLLASFAGWWVGSRKRLTDFEREGATA